MLFNRIYSVLYFICRKYSLYLQSHLKNANIEYKCNMQVYGRKKEITSNYHTIW
jgi:hypothetical protein